jgi:hypothetical protein
LFDQGLEKLGNREITTEELRALVGGIPGLQVYWGDDIVIVTIDDHQFVFVYESRTEVIEDAGPTGGEMSYTPTRTIWFWSFKGMVYEYKTKTLLEHHENDKTLRYLQGKEIALTAALNMVPFGSLSDAIASGELKDAGDYVEQGVYLAGDTLIVAGFVLRGGKYVKVIYKASIAVDAAGAAVAAHSAFSNMQQGKSWAGQGGEFMLRLASMGLGLNSLRLSNAKDKIGKIASEAQALEKVAENAPRAGAGLVDNALPVLNKTCFVAGTPILTPDGETEIDQLQVGDEVLARSEADAQATVRPRAIEKIFELSAPILELRLGGQTIETTAEHPFFVAEKGWVRANELQQGDLLVGHDDKLTAVETITTTDRHETVYNIRVAEDHTYFVGREEWGFSVWVHNAYSIRRAADGTWEVLDDAGEVVRRGLTGNEADLIRKHADGLADALRRFPNAQPMDINKLANLGPTAGGHSAFDPRKLARRGPWDWNVFDEPIQLVLENGVLKIEGGLTRIQMALRAGVTQLPVEIRRL